MAYPETKFLHQVTHTKKGERPLSKHIVDQFGHYSEAMQPALEDRKNDLDADNPIFFSAVKFALPYSQKEWSPFTISPELTVIGDGSDIEVYGRKIFTPDQLASGDLQRSINLSQIFDSKEFNEDRLGFKHQDRLPTKATDVYTTAISPFLHQVGYPPYGQREYALWSGYGAAYLKVTSDIQPDRYNDKLKIVYEEDARDYLPYTIATLTRDRTSGVWIAQMSVERPHQVSFSA